MLKYIKFEDKKLKLISYMIYKSYDYNIKFKNLL